MAIPSTDIKQKLSTKSGTAGHTLTSTTAESLGKYISTTEIVGGTLHNLFDVISGNENLGLDVEYRCFFLHNANATETLLNTLIYIVSETPGGANLEIGIDPTVASVIGDTNSQAIEIANEGDAPVGVTFSAPTTFSAALLVGNLLAGNCRAIWVKRTATNSPSQENDGAKLRIQGETV